MVKLLLLAVLVGNLSDQLRILRDVSLLDVGVVAFGGIDGINSFLCSQHVLARSCDCSRYQISLQ